ncbi:hypothetical protein KIPB_003460 [Kipferlia bialata]|uniref:Uncharacterized protein n=1 Tax=Kipferlia bialata TaxID=797122 RepID=A0A9K3CU39_9EUKA|nr:hypothetical protein KIPB_003460 [Kipferlia bialata]|eukprot:g3460.t1
MSNPSRVTGTPATGQEAYVMMQQPSAYPAGVTGVASQPPAVSSAPYPVPTHNAVVRPIITGDLEHGSVSPSPKKKSTRTWPKNLMFIFIGILIGAGVAFLVLHLTKPDGPDNGPDGPGERPDPSTNIDTLGTDTFSTDVETYTAGEGTGDMPPPPPPPCDDTVEDCPDVPPTPPACDEDTEDCPPTPPECDDTEGECEHRRPPPPPCDDTEGECIPPEEETE